MAPKGTSFALPERKEPATQPTRTASRATGQRRTTGLGAWGENFAYDMLLQSGMRILARNWCCALGEIDLIALDGDHLVVVEVKTRRDDARGSALAAVTPTKVAKLRRLIGLWLVQQPQPPRTRAIRIDVVAITRPRTGATQVMHVRGVQ